MSDDTKKFLLIGVLMLLHLSCMRIAFDGDRARAFAASMGIILMLIFWEVLDD